MRVAPGPETYKMVSEFKEQLRKKTKHLEKKPLLQKFPDNPADLPKELFDRAFGEEEPSPPKNNAGAESSTVVARKSHNSVKKSLQFNDPMAAMMQPLSQMPSNITQGNMNGMNPMMLMAAGAQFMMQQFGGMSHGDGSNLLQVFGNRRPKSAPRIKRGPLAIGEGRDSGDSQPVDEEDEDEEEEEESQKPPDKSKCTPMFDLGMPDPDKKGKKPEDYVKDFNQSVKKRKAAALAAKVANVEEDEPGDEGAEESESKHPKKKPAKAEKKAKACPAAAPKKAANKGSAHEAALAATPAEEGVKRKDLGPKPPPPDPWTTFWWGSGKINKNPKASSWRVFVERSDKNDKKVKFGDDLTASFHRALEIIEEGMAARGL